MVDWYFLDYGIRHWREVKWRGNEEQTAYLQTVLLHLLCGPRYEPLGGAPFAMRDYANAFPESLSSLSAAGLTCLLHLQFHVLRK